MSLPCSFTNTQDYFKNVLTFLSKYRWLYKEANTEILTKTLLDYFPIEWLKCFEEISNEELNEFPFGYIHESWPKTLKEFITELESLKPKIPYHKCVSEFNLPHDFFRGLSLKKKHEILNFAPVIHELCKSSGVNVIVDIGAGLGYLPQLLHKQYGYKVLGVEADKVKLQTAVKRQNELYKDSLNFVKYLHHFVDDSSSVVLENNLLDQNLINDNESVCLIGLHACADLSISLVRIFDELSRVKIALVMPCCYHRLKKIEFDVSRGSDAELFENFPVSSSLRNVYDDHEASEFLTRAFLRLACQNTAGTWRIMSREDHRRHAVGAMRRAVLQFVSEQGGYHLSRLKRKSHFNKENDSFISYLDGLKSSHVLTHSKMADQQQLIDSECFREEMTKTWEKYKQKCSILEVYSAFQTSLQSLCENLILLDRVEMVKEQGFTCFIQKITDDCLSPRCFALVAKKPELFVNICQT